MSGTDQTTKATTRTRRILAGPIVGIVLGIVAMQAGLAADACWTAGITGLCAVWWVTEAIPIPATSLVPFALFPLTGVATNREVATAYGHWIILLLLGGFLLSKGVEASGLHRRVALGMVRTLSRFGRRGLVLGFMVATATSSMWISNTATVLMLLPVVAAVLDADDTGELRVPLLLGIAYAASIGGIGTPIGTPPNVYCIGAYEDAFGRSITFVEWMSWGVPVVAVMIPIAWLLLTRRLGKARVPELPTVGAWTTPERRVAIVFAITALAWVFRKTPFGGWSALFGLDGVGDDTIALTAAIVMFVLPSGNGGPLLDWKTAERIPWGLLILFGGGIAIAQAFASTGLSKSIGAVLEGLADAPALLLVLVICATVTFLTEITSNTATTVLLMPILAEAARGAERDPRLLMVPAAIAASCAFMMPVATAPNAIVFGTGRVEIRTMVREGFGLNLVAILAVTAGVVAILT